MPHHPLLASATLLVAVVTVLMLIGIVRTLVLLRRWRTRPETRPQGPWAMALRVGLPLIANLGWGLGLLLVFPQVAYPLRPTMLIVPDLGYLIVASALVALTWGVVRTVLAYLALAGGNREEASGDRVFRPGFVLTWSALVRGRAGGPGLPAWPSCSRASAWSQFGTRSMFDC